MVTKEQINRINELAKKQRKEGLTEEEKKEQQQLRRLYIDSMKESLESQLKMIRYEGSERNTKKYRN